MNRGKLAALSDREIIFAREYLVDLNAEAAARRAGYAEDSAASSAPRLLQRVRVREAIQQLMDERAARIQVRADDVLQELAKVADVDIGKMFDEAGQLLPISDIPEDVRRAISSYSVTEDARGRTTVKWTFNNKNEALKLLGQHLKLFTEKHEVTGKDGEPLVPIAEIRAALLDKLAKVREVVAVQEKKKEG